MRTLQEAVRFVLVIGALVGVAVLVIMIAGSNPDFWARIVVSGIIALIYGMPIGLVIWDPVSRCSIRNLRRSL